MFPQEGCTLVPQVSVVWEICISTGGEHLPAVMKVVRVSYTGLLPRLRISNLIK
jgi:hypothetical protein